MDEKCTYIVTGLTPVKQGTELLGEGDEIELNADEGAELLRQGIVAVEAVVQQQDQETQEPDPLIDKLVEIMRGGQHKKPPAIKLLKEITGIKDISAAQRDAAWAIYNDESND